MSLEPLLSTSQCGKSAGAWKERLSGIVERIFLLEQERDRHERALHSRSGTCGSYWHTKLESQKCSDEIHAWREKAKLCKEVLEKLGATVPTEGR